MVLLHDARLIEDFKYSIVKLAEFVGVSGGLAQDMRLGALPNKLAVLLVLVRLAVASRNVSLCNPGLEDDIPTKAGNRL